MSTHTNGLLAGGKFNGNHSSVIKDARGIVQALRKSKDVYKITVGFINPYGSARRVKFHDTQAGFRLDVYCSDGIQEFYIYTKNREKVKELVNRFLKKKGWD